MNIMDDISMAFSYFGVVSEYPYAKFLLLPHFESEQAAWLLILMKCSGEGVQTSVSSFWTRVISL